MNRGVELVAFFAFERHPGENRGPEKLLKSRSLDTGFPGGVITQIPRFFSLFVISRHGREIFIAFIYKTFIRSLTSFEMTKILIP
jgi:hypothetical protein